VAPSCRPEGLAPEAGAAADAEAPLERAVCLAVLARCPDEGGEDDDDARDGDEEEQDSERSVHGSLLPVRGRRNTPSAGRVGLPDREGLYPDGQRVDWLQDEIGRADHRKLYVIDGAIAWSGGAGIEDHCGVPGELPRSRRRSSVAAVVALPGSGRSRRDAIALAQVIPGGHVAASQAIGEQIDCARERLDLMNPYVTDRGMIDRIVAAARRGVR
jgi:phosphatidylserine/phosphatidylglycerophosphate/cardiolipin synthase-like enzyme